MPSDPGISNYLFTQGVLGVAVFVLGWISVKLYNKTEKQQARIEALQDLRLEDSKEVTKDVTSVLQGNTQSNYVLAGKIEAGKRNS